MLTLTVVLAGIAMLVFVGFLLSFRSASASDRLKPRARSFTLLVARRAAGVYVRDEQPAGARRRFRRRRRKVATTDPL